MLWIFQASAHIKVVRSCFEERRQGALD